VRGSSRLQAWGGSAASCIVKTILCYTVFMKLTAKVKLVANQIPHAALMETMARANAACNWISVLAWEKKVFQAFAIQKIAYHRI
jgi:hypothetical protein